MNSEKRLILFQNELRAISDNKIRKFTKQCLLEGPDYFFDNCPSSSSGKYHPADELKGNGTVIHTKRVVKVAKELARGLDVLHRQDEIMSAAILHDIMKQGKRKSGHTVKEHPNLAAIFIDEIAAKTSLLMAPSWAIIKNCVGHHMGPWSIFPWKKNMKEYTGEELSLYLADYISSRRWIGIEVK